MLTAPQKHLFGKKQWITGWYNFHFLIAAKYTKTYIRDNTGFVFFFFVCYLFSQLVMTLIGVLANAATYAAIKRNKTCFSEAIRVLLLNQSLLDCLACLFAVIILLQVSFVYVFASYNNNINI